MTLSQLSDGMVTEKSTFLVSTKQYCPSSWLCTTMDGAAFAGCENFGYSAASDEGRFRRSPTCIQDCDQRGSDPCHKVLLVCTPDVTHKAQIEEFIIVLSHDKGMRIPLTITDYDRQREMLILVVLPTFCRRYWSQGERSTNYSLCGYPPSVVAASETARTVLKRYQDIRG